MAKKLTLADVKPRIVTVTVENKQLGEMWEADIALPTLADWNNAQFGIEFPVPDEKDIWDTKAGHKTKKLDFNDPEYLRKRELAFETLNMRRVTQALLGGGNFSELAKLPLNEAAEKLIAIADRDFLRGVFQAMLLLINDTKGAVESKQAAFPVPTPLDISHEDMPVETQEPSMVAIP